MNSQRWLSLNYFTFFFTWGVFLPYWTGWLITDKGLSVPAASIIMGAGMIARSLSMLIVFPIATKLYAISVVMRGMAIAALVTMLFYIPFESYTALFVITVLFSAIYPNLMPGMESSASVLIRTEKIHYGKSRSYGSLGYTIALVFVGGVTELFGIGSVLWIMIAGLLMMVASQWIAAPAKLSDKPKRKETNEGVSLKELFTSGSFGIVLVVSILLQGAHASYYNYGYIFLDDLGINSFYIGLILNVAVIIEIGFFLKADALFSEFRPSTLFGLAAIGSTIRWVAIFLFPNVWVFILVQALHAVSFGFAHYAFIQYISSKLKASQIPTAQGMYSAFAMSLSVALLTFLGGYLYEIEPGAAFLGMLICTVPALILVAVTRQKLKY
ncbi:MFS transporter [Lysinibacillus sp. LZ02]|uniref:MFS transporter n=1 Tax=Lysinibacillus sp. LZ02 TaxID=3420668 RepID=UPI003D362C13